MKAGRGATVDGERGVVDGSGEAAVLFVWCQ